MASGSLNRTVTAFAAGLFTFAFIIVAYGLWLLFGNLVIFAAAASVVIAVFVYLVDKLTDKGADVS
jgi:hypothetical protein